MHRRPEALASRELRKIIRYGEFATEHGWMMLSILANSTAFRYACHSLDDNSWADLNLILTEQTRSIEMFAKVRGLNWGAVLARKPHVGKTLTDADIRSTMTVSVDHPHNFALPEEGNPQRPRKQGRNQVNVNENIYDAALLASGPRPTCWPAEWPFPSDPTIRRTADGPCHLCNSNTACGCNIASAMLNPLVEIVTYPTRGNGVRALQDIPAGVFLAEYLGEILPINSNADPVYSLVVNSAEGGDLYQVSSRFYGNWTRYVNHSCNAKAVFDNSTVGNQTSMCIRTVRETKMFEEITVNYGDTYWHENSLCHCGEPECKYDTPEKARAARFSTVGEAPRREFQTQTEELRKKKRQNA